jgi:dihydropteroate synthase-like protein
LKRHYGVPFERGPEEIVDLPFYFGKTGRPADLTRHDTRIFAEIVEAPTLTVDTLIARATVLASQGADVIDIGCQPDVPFPHLEEVVRALAKAGYKVSVDSGDVAELKRGAQAGADYVLSLDETTLDAIAGTKTVPILIPKPHGDLKSLIRTIDLCKAKGIPHLADPILDPIHFGFTASLQRYAELRRQRPEVEMLMGTGNLTELTDADSQGVTAVLLGICSELKIGNVLVVQVSPHTRRTVQEHDAARRLMLRAREDESLPKGYNAGLISLHDLRPFPQSPEQIAASAEAVRDQNFRIEVAEDGIHIYNRDGHHIARDPFDLYEKLGVGADGPHAFYLGYELAKAEIALALGKRYTQDAGLNWGVAADRKSEDLTRHAPEGSTKQAARKEKTDAADRRDDRDDDERDG